MDSQPNYSPCNVCGGSNFEHGPSDRLSINNRLPRCQNCKSLERHRVARRIFDGLRPFLDGKRLLQFSPDPGLDKNWFSEMIVSVWGRENSYDMQAIALPSGRYDWIYSSHVLNHIPDTDAALKEMLRVVGNEGVVALSVGGTVFNYERRPSTAYCGQDRQFRIYGTEFADDIQAVLPDVAVLELVAADPSTASIDSIYLYSRAVSTLKEMARRSASANIHARVFMPREMPREQPAAAPVAEPRAKPADLDVPIAACNVCGAKNFGPGPSDRRTAQGRMPRCLSCGSLERHRVTRHVFDALNPTFTSGKRLFEFEEGPGLPAQWFSEVFVASKKNGINVLKTGLEAGRYDWVRSSHVISEAPEDRAALREMLRVAGSKGVVAMSLRGSTSRYERIVTLEKTTDIPEARDFVIDVQQQLPDTSMLEMVTDDPSTGSVDAVYFCSRDPDTLRAIAKLAEGSFHVRFFLPGQAAVAAASATEREWNRLRTEIMAWKAAGHRARFWVRDDDAGAYSERLAELVELCSQEKVPIALAVIPDRAEENLAEAVRRHSVMTVLQHGYDHRNRSSTSLKSEFPDERPVDEALDSVRRGWTTLKDRFGDRVIPVFVPPWGVCSAAVRSRLAQAGLTGYSGSQIGPFRPLELCRRGAPNADGLAQAGAHIAVNRADPKDTAPLPIERHLTFLANLVHAIRTEEGDRNEPIGIMTHAWGVDADVRRFLRELVKVTRDAGAEWVSAPDVFGQNN